MKEFFRGWRRKVGVVTLVMACVFMGGWIRSSAMFDGIESVSLKSRYCIYSIKGRIRWSLTHSDQARVEKQETRFPSFQLKEKDTGEFKAPEKYSGFVMGDFFLMSWSNLWGHYSDLVQSPGPPASVSQTVAQVPYWSVVIPLTLLSAYLLLTKPKTLTQKKICQPIPDEGGAAS